MLNLFFLWPDAVFFMRYPVPFAAALLYNNRKAIIIL